MQSSTLQDFSRGESVQQPLRYWNVNVNGSRCLLEAMASRGCHTLVFSSSATLYGYPDTISIPKHPCTTQPLRSPKAAGTDVVRLAIRHRTNGGSLVYVICLVGAHPSGRIGEDPGGIPNNLFPFLSQAAVGLRPSLQVFGGDWPTLDEHAWDYIHVMDVAAYSCPLTAFWGTSAAQP